MELDIFFSKWGKVRKQLRKFRDIGISDVLRSAMEKFTLLELQVDWVEEK